MNSVKVLAASLNAGELRHRFSVWMVLTYQIAASLHLLSAAIAWVLRRLSRSRKYLSISSGQFSSKQGAVRSCWAGRFAKAILGMAGGGFTGGCAFAGGGTGTCGMGGTGGEGEGAGACGVFCVFAFRGGLVGLATALEDACCCCCCCWACTLDWVVGTVGGLGGSCRMYSTSPSLLGSVRVALGVESVMLDSEVGDNVSGLYHG